MQSKQSVILGYAAGIITGVTYGLNPLFAVPLIRYGISVDVILFLRYTLAACILGIVLICHRTTFRVSRTQCKWLVLLGLLFASSSLLLFEAYNYIPSGIATTIIFLYPILVALIMVFLRVYPTWQVWLSIVVTFVGVLFLCHSENAQPWPWQGLALTFAAALAYAIFIVIVNRSHAIAQVSDSLLTFYVLVTGTVMFLAHMLLQQTSPAAEIAKFAAEPQAWLNIIGLAVFPTIISTATLATATKRIGATKASVMGVFEPITAVVVGAAAFGETITINVVIGIALTIAAITFMILTGKETKSETAYHQTNNK